MTDKASTKPALLLGQICPLSTLPHHEISPLYSPHASALLGALSACTSDWGVHNVALVWHCVLPMPLTCAESRHTLWPFVTPLASPAGAVPVEGAVRIVLSKLGRRDLRKNFLG